jgi:hypothetical protein
MHRAALAICPLLVAAFLLTGPAAAQAERTMYLGLCQELVNMARQYEARAANHARAAQNLMAQIESQARAPSSSATSAAMDHLFNLYDEHRAMETKLRQLYRKASREADKCLNTVE